MADNQAQISRPDRAAHLRRFQFTKGTSGNPKGRPKGRTLLETIRDQLTAGDEAAMRAVAKAYVEAMKSGSFPHAKEYIEREEGKLPDNGNLRVEIVYVRPSDHANGTDRN